MAVTGREYGISQPVVSQHLKVLRESGFATLRPDAQRRLYSIDSAPLEEIDRWLAGRARHRDRPRQAQARLGQE